MNQIRPISETAESVTLNRSDFEALQEELEDTADRIAVLEDCIIDMKPDLNKYLLTMDETMRIIDGEHPIKVWREKRGVSVRELADSLGLHDAEIEEIEKGRAVDRGTLLRIASRLDVLSDMLAPPEVAA
jgi:DNA-binding Xre family transcriptional regulator